MNYGSRFSKPNIWERGGSLILGQREFLNFSRASIK
jgi:hypothetical protein